MKKCISQLNGFRQNSVMKKIIFLGSKSIGFDCLQFLTEKAINFDAEVIAVFTSESQLDDPDKNIRLLCERLAIPTFKQANDLLNLPTVDLLISVQYHEILKAQHLARATQLAVNLHMAPLPEYRGCNQFSFAILDEAQTFGTTLHTMDTSIDGGSILFENRFAIPKNCWVKDLYELTYDASVKLFEENIQAIIDNNVVPIPQKTLVAERGTSFHLRKEINKIKEIDMNWGAEKINRHIRATYFPPYEPPFTFVAGKKVYLTCEKI